MDKQTVRLLGSSYRLAPNDTLTTVWMRPGVFTGDECDRILGLAEQQPSATATTDRPVADLRESQVSWLFPAAHTEWLFARLQGILAEVNRNYRFELKGFYEGAQIARYSPGGHYDWHMDIGGGAYSNRKLSMSLQLSDGDEYAGGDLEFRARQAPVLRERGSLIVFPSYLEHRVTPVTRGVRLSLVSWIGGPAFR